MDGPDPGKAEGHGESGRERQGLSVECRVSSVECRVSRIEGRGSPLRVAGECHAGGGSRVKGRGSQTASHESSFEVYD
eukprot:2128637-Rhodomonas_salina.2